MPIVVFICDWKNDDYYRAMVDGMLYSVNPDLKVTYATTHIDFNDIFQLLVNSEISIVHLSG
jgi:S-adenosylmethionine hydrolase